MAKKRFLFSIEDFKTTLWGQELKKYDCDVVPNGERLHSPITQIISGFFQKRRIHVFIFRYLNDSESLYESVLFFIRDFLVILTCKLLGVKVFWLLHNIDEETHHNYPGLSKLRRKMVEKASNRIFVMDSNLIEVAEHYGIKKSKLDWTCFGTSQTDGLDQKNIELKQKISCFRESLRLLGYSTVYLGLCVSEPAQKKNHYLKADTIVGKCQHPGDCCVGLVMIGKYPEGGDFELAKEKAIESPYILFIEESFSVYEHFIAEQIDFFYRGLTDQSIAYTLYVAADLEKPIIVHNTGALPLIVEKENLGFTIDENDSDVPDKIVSSVLSWSPEGAQNFFLRRSWETGAKRFINAIENY